MSDIENNWVYVILNRAFQMSYWHFLSNMPKNCGVLSFFLPAGTSIIYNTKITNTFRQRRRKRITTSVFLGRQPQFPECKFGHNPFSKHNSICHNEQKLLLKKKYTPKQWPMVWANKEVKPRRINYAGKLDRYLFVI